MTFVEVDENYEGRCVILNDNSAHISTYSCGKKWFLIDDKTFYDPIKKEEFDNALKKAISILKLL